MPLQKIEGSGGTLSTTVRPDKRGALYHLVLDSPAIEVEEFVELIALAARSAFVNRA